MKSRTNILAWLALCLCGAAAQAAEPPIDRLAAEVARTESVRAIKTLQRRYAQLAHFGEWRAIGAMFAADATFTFDDRVIAGRPAISRFLADRYGDGGQGLAAGTLHTMFVETPVINLSADGRSAKGRWHVLVFQGGRDGSARIEGGIFENGYAWRNGRWMITAAHYYPQYDGPYEQGWVNWGKADLPLVPYHFTPREAGLPVPPIEGAAPPSGRSVADLAARIAALNAEDAVRNLQAAYGYYVDRRMWSDAVDLFARDGAVRIEGAGTYAGPAAIRRAHERMGPEGLTHGILNDRPQFDVVVDVMPGGREAYARGIELGMLGDADAGKAWWEISLFRNRFVREDGVWKLAEVRSFPVLKADYHRGWGKGRVPADALPAPDQATAPPTTDQVRRAFFTAPRQTARAAIAAGEGDVQALRRGLKRSVGYDAVENIASAYGDYLDDFQSTEMGGLFAPQGFKVSAFAGYYVGGEKITRAARIVFGPPPVTRPGISYHWRIQPVIAIAEDGRSANLRVRLFQPRTSKEVSRVGDFYAAGFHGGMYHDQAVLDGDGVWKMWNLSLDEPYFFSTDWKGGWSAAKDPVAGFKPRPSPLLATFPPEVPYTALGKRLEHFRGGTGTTIEWPGILPMWFEYRNPVSGRVPEHYMPDCVPCEFAPHLSMTRHGYRMPPTGPEEQPR
jgi:hypothetical protein